MLILHFIYGFILGFTFYWAIKVLSYTPSHYNDMDKFYEAGKRQALACMVVFVTIISTAAVILADTTVR